MLWYVPRHAMSLFQNTSTPVWHCITYFTANQHVMLASLVPVLCADAATLYLGYGEYKATALIAITITLILISTILSPRPIIRIRKSKK